MLGYLNFIIAYGCVSAFILLCCIIGLIVEKIQDNKEKDKKRAEFTIKIINRATNKSNKRKKKKIQKRLDKEVI